jgi:uncharacterized protein (TIGR03086 family)
MPMVDLAPAARRMADVLAGVPEGPLDGATPCPAYKLGDLLDHVATLTFVFTAAAAKQSEEIGSQPPSADAARLADDWRTEIPRDLDVLTEAWRDPDAWTGFTKAGGIDLPGEVAGLVVLDELVVHAWDIARATGQPYDADPATLDAVHGFVMQFAAPGQEAIRDGIFGPPVDIPTTAPLLDRVIALTGRNPTWSPT